MKPPNIKLPIEGNFIIILEWNILLKVSINFTTD